MLRLYGHIAMLDTVVERLVVMIHAQVHPIEVYLVILAPIRDKRMECPAEANPAASTSRMLRREHNGCQLADAFR